MYFVTSIGIQLTDIAELPVFGHVSSTWMAC